MKIKHLTIAVALFSFYTLKADKGNEGFGNTLNLGLGLGYYSYAPYNMPVLHADYEFDVAKNFTLAPSISFIQFRSKYFWGDKNYPYKYYSYRQTILPVGVKGSYYFDDAINLPSKWDVYGAGTLGFALVNSHWEQGYYGEKSFYRNRYAGASPLFLDLHIGAEYHINSKTGVFLDFSTGVSTVGIAMHL